MLKTFPIDFIRQILEQKLFMEHLKDENLFGGKDQMSLISFYEQLQSQAEVDRFVETFRDLTSQQNRMGLIGNGIIISPENPTYTNIYSSLIIPLTFTCDIRCSVEDRDQMIWTINNLIDKLKGRKVDIAQLDCKGEQYGLCAKPFMVGTIGQESGVSQLKNGDFIGDLILASDVQSVLNNLRNENVVVEKNKDYYLYCGNDNKLKVLYVREEQENATYQYGASAELVDNIYIYDYIVLDSVYDAEDIDDIIAQFIIYGDGYVRINVPNYYVEDITTEEVGGEERTVLYVKFTLDQPIQDYVTNYSGFGRAQETVLAGEKTYRFVNDDGTIDEIIFPPEHDSFEKYKVSLSFDSIRCDEPRNLEQNEVVDVSFGGSATLVSEGVQFGNDLLKINIRKLGIPADTPIDFEEDENNPNWWLEPLELPSGLNANTNPVQLISNKFKTNGHTDAIALTLQYTFIYDKNVSLLRQWFNYARYGAYPHSTITYNDITPNMIYGIKEIWCSWGEYEVKEIKTKLAENVDVENTESDTLTLSMTMQIQGDND